MENKIEIFKSIDNSIELQVALDTETVWLSQEQMAQLFGKGRSTITEHISNVFAEGELEQDRTCRKFRQVRTEGNREVEREIDFYNLDVIISVGYRVKSLQGIQFRQWATARLKNYLVQGYAINEVLATLTIFVATSKTEEVDVVKSLIVSILNNYC